MAEKSRQKVAEKSRHSGYARLPREVLTDEKLSHSAVRVYGMISLNVGEGSVARIGQRLFAKKLGMDRGTVAAALHELAAAGHLKIVAAGRGMRRTYVLASLVFSQKQGKETVVVSSPRGDRRYASVDTEEVA